MTVETKKFDAEVGKILHLMIHSLYTNKEIFLRELISNASDACDKLRYLSQQDASLMDSAEFKIVVSLDKEKRQLIIKDNGIGMNKQDMVENLGTIARSGTQGFLESLSGDAKKDAPLIGQFGVGFYSVYMVADKVTVTSCKAGEKEFWQWESDGLGEYSVSSAPFVLDTRASVDSLETSKTGGSQLKPRPRETIITIDIKEGEDLFLDHFRLKQIIKNYSDHIAVPIYFADSSGTEIKLNSSSALWTRSKSEVTDEQYQEFYRSVSHAADKPWLTLHNKNEGAIEFTNLLFIPSDTTFDLFHPDRKRRVKLYIKRVFISDENIELVPQYMRFVRGVVDSEDLPLNISRETLQHNATIDKIRNAITKRVLTELKKKKTDNRQEYEIFWKNFGAALKEGLCEALTDHDQLIETCLFRSVLTGRMIGIEEYIAALKPDQNTIYYLSGESLEKMQTSPQIEGFISKGIDVLLFTDSVDDFWVSVTNKYKDYEFKSVTRSEIDPSQEAQDEVADEENKPLVDFFKEVLQEVVKDVKVSKKLTESPVCLAVGAGAMDIRMERFLLEQKQIRSASAKILEINPKHQIIKKIQSDLGSEASTDLVKMLYDQACIVEGEPVADVAGFCKRMNKLLG
jgi:molecular chaperone HtpG